MILSWVILKTKATFSLQFTRSDKWLSCYVIIETFVSPCIFDDFNLKIFTPSSIWIWIDVLNIPSLFIFKVLIPNKVCWHLTFSLTPPFKYILHINGVHCVNSVRIRSYSGLLFPVFELRMRENVDQNNSEYGHFRALVCFKVKLVTGLTVTGDENKLRSE